jgi:hypothetical protein
MVRGDGTIWKNRVHRLDFLPSSLPGEEQNIVARFIFYYTSLGMPYEYFISLKFLLNFWPQNKSKLLPLSESDGMLSPTRFACWTAPPASGHGTP